MNLDQETAALCAVQLIIFNQERAKPAMIARLQAGAAKHEIILDFCCMLI